VAGQWRALPWVATAALWLASAPARAEEPSVALVVESDLDALELRAAVAEALGRPITTLSRAQATLGGPSIVLTIAVDHDAGISVMYWDRDGAEWLTAPIPADPAAVVQVAAQLAAALVQQRDRSAERAQRLLDNPYLLPKASEPRRHGISPFNPYYHAYRRLRGS
jgi:hypothetical protein